MIEGPISLSHNQIGTNPPSRRIDHSASTGMNVRENRRRVIFPFFHAGGTEQWEKTPPVHGEGPSSKIAPRSCNEDIKVPVLSLAATSAKHLSKTPPACTFKIPVSVHGSPIPIKHGVLVEHSSTMPATPFQAAKSALKEGGSKKSGLDSILKKPSNKTSNTNASVLQFRPSDDLDRNGSGIGRHIGRIFNPRDRAFSLLDSPTTTATDPNSYTHFQIPPSLLLSARNGMSKQANPVKKTTKISFDPRVWVREFERSQSERELIWYTPQELESFRIEAVLKIMTYHQMKRTELIPTGTGRFVQKYSAPPRTVKLDFSHRALRSDEEAEDDDEDEQDMEHLDDEGALSIDVTDSLKLAKASKASRLACLARAEIQNVLVVDPHKICLKLFQKSFENLLPHAEVHTASSGERALRQLRDTSFDFVVVEEQLTATRKKGGKNRQSRFKSGCSLLKEIIPLNPTALYVGVSIRLEADSARLTKSGADFCWTKPPPIMNEALLETLLDRLLEKRGKTVS